MVFRQQVYIYDVASKKITVDKVISIQQNNDKYSIITESGMAFVLSSGGYRAESERLGNDGYIKLLYLYDDENVMMADIYNNMNDKHKSITTNDIDNMFSSCSHKDNTVTVMEKTEDVEEQKADNAPEQQLLSYSDEPYYIDLIHRYANKYFRSIWTGSKMTDEWISFTDVYHYIDREYVNVEFVGAGISKFADGRICSHRVKQTFSFPEGEVYRLQEQIESFNDNYEYVSQLTYIKAIEECKKYMLADIEKSYSELIKKVQKGTVRRTTPAYKGKDVK